MSEKLFEVVGFVRSALRVRVDLCVLADQVMAAHSVLAALLLLWGVLVGGPWVAGFCLVQWVAGFVIWLEFKHGEG
jgi:hypothetical protein